MTKKVKKKHIHLYAAILSVLSVVAILISLAGLYINDKIINTQVNTVRLQFMDTKSASKKLQNHQTMPKTIAIQVYLPQKDQHESFNINPEDFGARINYTKTAQMALVNSSVSDLWNPKKMNLVVEYDMQKLDQLASLVAGQVFVPPEHATIKKLNTGELQVNQGKVGYELNVDELTQKIHKLLKEPEKNSITIELKKVGRTIESDNLEEISLTFDNFRNKEIEVRHADKTWRLEDIDLLQIQTGIGSGPKDPLESLTQRLKNEVETLPQNPVFKEENGKVIEFAPAKEGVELNEKEFLGMMKKALTDLGNGETQIATITLPVVKTQPEIKTAQVNQYGIKELIGKGVSSFKGSVPNRVHNIALAAEKINGTLVAPGETFSFNNTIGDISVYTGFKQSYIIQGNQTVLGDGGGVCQVSTTLFRAALNSGLPIAERRAHSYRVTYYEQGSPPGLDATIYSPTVDFKFTNDTPGHILIQAGFDSKEMTLVFEIYGTDDGREVTVTEPKITSVTPPPEPLYIEEPGKPAGYMEQIDFAASGARVEYDYIVKRGSETLIDKTFYSNYRPWQAKFIRGTGGQ